MLLILIALITIFVLYLVRQYFKVWQYSEQFPGKKTLPIIGNGHQIGNTSYEYLQNLFSWTKEYKFEAFRAWLGPQLFVILTNPEEVEIILSSNKYLEKFEDYRFLHDWIGQGLITSKGQQWFSHRKLITPAFHFKILNDFHHVMSKGVNQLIKKFDLYAAQQKTFDVQDLVNLATLDVICETAMGIEVHALDDPESKLVGAFHDASFAVYQRIFSSWKRFDLLFPLSKDYQTHTKAVNVLRQFNKEVIEKKRNLLTSSSVKKATEDSDDMPKIRHAFLDTILNATIDGVPLTDDEISDETSTFIFAGHDTTAAGISFVLYHLSIYPEEQKKVYEEQLSIFGDEIERDSSYQDIQEMKYLDLFIKESHRLIPPVSFIGRKASENITLNNGKIIPEGTSVGILLFAMGHNPKVFPNPEVFNPERFLSDARTNKNPYEYVPFSAGSRNCIGQRFAQLEIRTVIAKLVRTYEILPPKEPFKPKLGATATTVSANGVLINVRRRK